MIISDISNLKSLDKVELICDNCGLSIKRTIRNVKLGRSKWNNSDICRSCSAKLSIHKKPQCSSVYWLDDEVKERHSLSIKNSESYKIGILNREDISGSKNPMFGKKHKKETIKKMSISRTGKIGENSTAWKGGKLSITRLVKGFQYRNGWYKKVYERDNFKCTRCNSKDRIEAHHIKPIKQIIDENKMLFEDNDKLYLYLINLDIIIDEKLENGITLCRNCHKKEHINFGSHYPITK
jgi:transcription elongation factor Elf1